MDSEDQLVNRIAKAIPSWQGAAGSRKSRQGGLRLGIGDDSAVLAPDGKADWVISCDAFLQDVHFLPHRHPPDSVGYKSLVRATSDLAAMGAVPRLFLLTLALPKTLLTTWLDNFLAGMGRAARKMGMRLAGGDTTRFPAVSISITVLGEIPHGLVITRAGAKPGDLIYVSGKLGRAQLGLELITKSFSKNRRYGPLLKPHLYPEIQLKLGAWLARHRIASAMMDISDGLSTDLPRLCKASGVGARLIAAHIPSVEIPASLQKILPKRALYPLHMALHGGEDYELLFTVPPRKAKSLRAAPGFSELTAIGEITKKKDLLIVSPDQTQTQKLRSLGWDPFRKR
jgi:thiamine-monophosphate kinase